MKVYFIPGLGFDDRIFRNLQLTCENVQYLNWMEPIDINEHIKSYAARLATPIEQSNEKVILIGHSFGGVMSQEIAQIKKVDKIILISSIKSRKELPNNFKFLKHSGLYKLFSKSLALNTFRFWGSYQGYQTKEEKELFVDMMNKQSDKYLQWALGQLAGWQNLNLTGETKLVHIHGDADKTFPIPLIEKPNHIIPEGNHFMVYKQPSVISELLNKELVS